MQFYNEKEKIIIIDFGSQVTKLIARRIRDLGVYSEIITPKKEGIILEDPSDSKSIAKAIDYLMDPKNREPMVKAARSLAEKFTQQRNASEMLKIYQEFIEYK